MSITTQIFRLQKAKADLKSSIKNKGVEVDDRALISDYAGLVDQISGGDEDKSLREMLESTTTYAYKFTGCATIETIIPYIINPKAVSMSYMFQNCTNLRELPANFNTSNVGYMTNFLENCKQIQKIQLDLPKLRTASSAFRGSSLNAIKLSNTSLCTTWNDTFRDIGNIESIETLDLSSATATGLSRIFYSGGGAFSYLQTLLFVPNTINYSISISVAPNLSGESIQSIIDGLAQVTTAQTLTLHSTAKAKLTQEQIAQATQKNWNIA